MVKPVASWQTHLAQLAPIADQSDLLHILLLEDYAGDAELEQLALAEGGINAQVTLVADREEFERAIASDRLDLILADYHMPGFDGMAALAIARSVCPEIPFIFVSGEIGEEIAIEALKHGAADYVFKHNLNRLVPCVRRALREVRERKFGRLAEAALSRSEARWHQVVANLPNGAVFIVDRDFRYLLAEGEALVRMGLTSEDLVGKTLWEALPPTLADLYAPYYRQALAGEIYSFEHYCHGRHYNTHGTPLYDERQEVYAVLAISYDITDRVKAEVALFKSQSDYRLLFESIDEGFCIIETIFDDLDRCIDYRFEQVNPAFFRLTGLPADAQGQTARELVPGLEEFWFETYGRVALTGAAIRFENESVSMQRWFDVFASRVGDTNSRRVAVLFTNITDRKQAEIISRRAAKFDEFRVKLTDAMRPLVDPIEIQSTACQILGEWLSVNRVAYFEMRDRHYYVVSRDYISGVPSIVGSYPIDAFGELTSSAYRHGQSCILTDAATDTRLSPDERAAHMAIDIHASIGIPLVKNGEFVAGLTVQSNTARQWTHEEIAIAQEVAERTLAAIERARAEVELRESNDRFYRAMQAVEGIVFEWNLQTDWVYRSEGLFDLIGVRAADATPTQAWWAGRIHPEDIPQLEAKMPGIVADKDRYECEYRVRHEDGRWIDVWERGYVQRNDRDEVIGIVGFTNDISERKRAAETIQQSEALAKIKAEELTALMEIVPAGIWIADDPYCHQIGANQAAYQMMRMPPGTPTTATPAQGGNPLPFKQLRQGEPIDPQDLPMQTATRTGQEVTDRIEFAFPDGEMRFIYGKAVPLYNAAGEVRGAIAAFTDITEIEQNQRERERLLASERAAREEADRANRLKDEFLAVLSHELRSPLNPILGWSKLLQSGKLSPDKTQQALQSIERNAHLQAEMIEDLLDVSRILQGKLSLNVAAVELAVTICAAAETMRLAAAAKSIALEIDLDPSVGYVQGDATRLQQVVWNLISNAVKFTPNGGRVAISLVAVANCAQITVSDNGKGIDREFLPLVFDYFKQEDGGVSRRFGGLGLGLAIVRQIVELHGGTVTAHSDGEGLGATFMVSIPLMSGAPAGNLSVDTATDPLDLDRARILVVDDEADSRDLIAFIATQAGAQVDTAPNAQVALDRLQQRQFDIILSDVGMPDTDGYQLIRQLRTLHPEQNARIPAIAITAYAGDFDRQQALQAGFERHIAKPIDPQELIRTIGELLESS